MQQEPSVGSAWASTILNYAAQYDLPVDKLCARVGLSPEALLDHSQRLPSSLVQQLFVECAAAGAGSQFGCELQAGLTTSCLQGLNILLDSAATLGASLNCLVEYLPEIMGHIQVELCKDGNNHRLLFTAPGEQPHAYGLDASTLALVRNMARRVGLAPAELFTEVHITAQQHCGETLDSWGVNRRYAEHLCLVLPSAALALPLLGANEFLHQNLLNNWGRTPNPATNAGNDGLRLARYWLKSSDQPIESIATRIGYSQVSNFIRAFRKQYGITPKKFRLSTC